MCNVPSCRCTSSVASMCKFIYRCVYTYTYTVHICIPSWGVPGFWDPSALLRWCSGGAPLPMGVKSPWHCPFGDLVDYTGGRCPDSSTTALQALELQLRRPPHSYQFPVPLPGGLRSLEIGRCCALDSCEPPSLIGCSQSTFGLILCG